MSQAATTATMIEVAAAVAADTDDHTHCLVCYDDLKARGKTPCHHDDICGVCHLRLRFLHEDKKCPICKQENEKVIVDCNSKSSATATATDSSAATAAAAASSPDTRVFFESYPMWDDDIGPGFVYRQDVGIFYEVSYYEQEILPLFGYGCHKCEYTAEQDTHNTSAAASSKHPPLRRLQDHLRTKHRLTLCNLCVDHKRDFVANLPRFSPNQLQKHSRQGDGPTSGFLGHPVCEFCKPKRFYDLAFLHQHLHKEHYKCHVCEKQGKDNQFFKNYKSLQRHFDQQHFLCHEVQCLRARFVVFDSELDLRAHEMSVHGGTSNGSTKINLEFRTRRAGYDGSGVENRHAQQEAPNESDFNYGLDGQAFVPQALPNSGGGDTRPQNAEQVQLHPLHQQRTEELRAQAAAIREQQSLENQEESFPTLQAPTNGSSAAPLVGWASGGTLSRIHRPRKQAGKVTEEDFPTLGPGGNTNVGAKKKAAMRGSLGATRRQFAAMNTSAARPSTASASNGWGNTAAAAAAALPIPSQFPSLPSSSSGGNTFLTPLTRAGTAAPVNRQANLASNNFPALGPSGNPRSTQNAVPIPQDYTKKFQTKQQNNGPRAPSVNSTAEFPTIGAANQNHQTSRPNGNSVRDRVLGTNTNTTPSQQATGNVLQAPSTSLLTAGNATVEEMKAALGSKKYKQLKRFTQEFSTNSLSPQGFIDQAAALFDRGYADTDFWSFLPSLLESCPNGREAEQALIYMTTLRQQQYVEKPSSRIGQPTAVNQNKNNSASTSWGNGPGIKVAPATHRATTNSNNQHLAQRVTPVANVRPVMASGGGGGVNRTPSNTIMAGKKKSAWGGTGSTTVARAKAPPGSVAAAAANQGPNHGSATKFMAKQAKQQTKATANQNKNNNNNKNGNGNANAANNKKKKKNKQNNELKALAFGGK